jgi:hypothetical protein
LLKRTLTLKWPHFGTQVVSFLKTKKLLISRHKTKNVMKLRLLSFLFVAFMPLLGFAQGSSLTIFSEDGVISLYFTLTELSKTMYLRRI